MDEKRYDVAVVKERLKTYSENQRDIDNQIERLERLITKMNGVGAQTISDMPRAKGVVGDRIADMVSQKDDLESYPGGYRGAEPRVEKDRKDTESAPKG